MADVLTPLEVCLNMSWDLLVPLMKLFFW